MPAHSQQRRSPAVPAPGSKRVRPQTAQAPRRRAASPWHAAHSGPSGKNFSTMCSGRRHLAHVARFGGFIYSPWAGGPGHGGGGRWWPCQPRSPSPPCAGPLARRRHGAALEHDLHGDPHAARLPGTANCARAWLSALRSKCSVNSHGRKRASSEPCSATPAVPSKRISLSISATRDTAAMT